jgi:hypothetical protein
VEEVKAWKRSVEEDPDLVAFLHRVSKYTSSINEEQAHQGFIVGFWVFGFFGLLPKAHRSLYTARKVDLLLSKESQGSNSSIVSVVCIEISPHRRRRRRRQGDYEPAA